MNLNVNNTLYDKIIEKRKMEGIIVENISNLYYIEIENEIYECTARGKLKQDEGLFVGDRVQIQVIDEESKKGVVEMLLPRAMFIKRPKIANLTQIIFVVSLKMPKPDLLLLDKQLAYAEYIKVNPIICINKIDLEGHKNEKDEIVQTYKSVGYKVIETIAKDKKGIDELKKLLENNITAFSGNSGVGKSTLINAIFEKDITTEGLISKKIKRGKNTTTNIKLYKIKEGEYIADTPGFSVFDISEIQSENLDKYFIEFKRNISKCEFVGCTHIKEQKCGIKQALEIGQISQERYERYCKIREHLMEKERYKW